MAGSFLGLGRVGVGVWLREDEEEFSVGAEAPGLAGDVAGGRRVRRVPRVPRVRRVRRVRLGRVNGFICLGLGVQDGFVW